MRDLINEHCEYYGKFCYSSEAKASRAMGRYVDIKHIYLCDKCDSWHTTSQVQRYVNEIKPPTKSQIYRELAKLIIKEKNKIY